MSECECHLEVKDREQSAVLWWLLGINAFMFLVEVLVGIISDSTGVLADSVDMFADASVYGVSLYAVGKAAVMKNHAAKISGFFQIFLGLGVFADILRRFVVGSSPESLWIMGIGIVALAANTVCLGLIAKHRQGEIHMRASWIFSKNDVIANFGVILAGAMVYWTGSRIPDLVIGAAISTLVIRGGIQIIREAREELA